MRAPKRPPMNEPTTPSNVVRMNPIRCSPGVIALASRPARNPKIIQPHSPMTSPRPDAGACSSSTARLVPADAHLTVYADDYSEDHRRAKIRSVDVDWLHGAVRRLEADAISLRVEPLDCCLILDQGDHDVPRGGRRRFSNEEIVAIEDAILDHRVPLDPQGEDFLSRAAQEKAIDADGVLQILSGQQRCPGRHLAEQGHVDHV